MKKIDEASQQSVECSQVQPAKIRYGAPDGPRKKRRVKNDGSEALQFLGHETVAQFLAAPISERQFTSLTALAANFKVTRMTVHRWKQDSDVLQRANWLSMRNQMAGDLLARSDWPIIMERAVRMAKNGDLGAMKFCATRAWPDEMRVEQSDPTATVSMRDLLGTGENNDAEESQDDSRQPDGDGR